MTYRAGISDTVADFGVSPSDALVHERSYQIAANAAVGDVERVGAVAEIGWRMSTAARR